MGVDPRMRRRALVLLARGRGRSFSARWITSWRGDVPRSCASVVFAIDHSCSRPPESQG
jgi:hypothetical protein